MLRLVLGAFCHSSLLLPKLTSAKSPVRSLYWYYIRPQAGVRFPKGNYRQRKLRLPFCFQGESASMIRHSATVPCRQWPIISRNSCRSAVRSAILRSTSAKCSRAIPSTASQSCSR